VSLTGDGRFGDHLGDVLGPVQWDGSPHLHIRGHMAMSKLGHGHVFNQLFCLYLVSNRSLATRGKMTFKDSAQKQKNDIVKYN